MAAMRVAPGAVILARSIFRPPLYSQVSLHLLLATSPEGGRLRWHTLTGYCSVRCDSSKSGGQDKKSPARMAEVQRLLNEAEERYKAAGGGAEPIPKITIDHVSVSYARSSGPGGQNVNKVNTKVDMRFNVKNAHWLSERVRERIMQVEKNRINKDGEIVISSTKTRTQKGNIEDALAKLQAIIDAASYVAPPPSEETVKKIAKLLDPSSISRVEIYGRFSKCRLSGSRDDWTRRNPTHKRKHFEEAETVGTRPILLSDMHMIRSKAMMVALSLLMCFS